ncbi:MAG TPA: hypothetical protein PKM73_08750 [Verrucomicrobiota bacterium]|nr:hypothetical protein [Verrucomicrobiota bacterium]HNU52457.1 hypothetical protein [Verrucomicrobiota bacterium]
MKALLATGTLAGLLALGSLRATHGEGAPADALADPAALRAAVLADWDLQERRLGRSPQSPEAIRAALRRAALLLQDLQRLPTVGDLSAERAELERLNAHAENGARLDEPRRLDLYRQIRSLARDAALRNPLVTSQPLLFMERRRAVGYMLYEYLGWYYAHGNNPDNGARNPEVPTPAPGGGLHVLEQPGRSLRTRPLIPGPEWRGHFVTLALAFDARTIYFAFADPAGKDPYARPGYAREPGQPGVKYNAFHLWAMNADGSHLRQITDGPHDDFDPCPLPDGGLAFQSTRRGCKLRCGGGSPEHAYTLHRMDADGANLRTLSFHETHEWHPSVLNDGRLVYTRWDYVDRNAAKFHGLWTCNPDGTTPASLFGNYTTRPWACYQAKAIPDSRRILFVAGGHHANVGGTLVLLDPTRASLDPKTGSDRFDALEWLTPEIPFPEADGWPKSYFYSPWPLSEDYYLVAFSHEPLSGGYTGQRQETETGLYYLDRFGNLELLYRRPGISAVYPIPLAPRVSPPLATGTVQPHLDLEGEFLLSDVHHSLLPMPAGRRVDHLRVFQLLPKSRTDSANDPRIGHPAESNARMLLGTVPVETDGSAYFRAPACKPLYFQAVDATGRAVQGMRTIVYLQPGERRSCVGCHEPPGAVPAPRQATAWGRPPSAIQPGPDGSHPFGYPRLIQPVLDRHCVRCHDGPVGPDKSPLVLTGDPAPQSPFSLSYENLKPYLRWPSYDAPASRPGQAGADLSPLSALLADENHGQSVQLPDADLRAIYLWLDAQVPFYGTYEEEQLAAQRLARAVPPPSLQ